MGDKNGLKRKEGPPEDILGTYLDEISRTPLLTREEEIELGRRARKGDKSAIEQLVEANLRFVVSIAKKYASSRVPLPDLINEGNIGLIEAAKRFDPNKANRFVTYAKWWIQQAIRSALAAQAGVVRLPVKQTIRLRAIKRAYECLRDKLDRAPDAREVAEYVGLSEAEVETLMRAAADAISIESSKEQGTDILEANLDDAETYGESEIERALILQSYTDRLRELIEQLNEQEKKVITLRFGLKDGVKRSLESIGQEMGLSRERIRQIEAAALRNMRFYAKERHLAVVLN
ncbi:MAG TPA: sigma-70 family RNA polymerase sigma factor [bacterium]|nr:sigma-70 family RNA polymerase sigma factor [bacterium]